MYLVSISNSSTEVKASTPLILLTGVPLVSICAKIPLALSANLKAAIVEVDTKLFASLTSSLVCMPLTMPFCIGSKLSITACLNPLNDFFILVIGSAAISIKRSPDVSVELLCPLCAACCANSAGTSMFSSGNLGAGADKSFTKSCADSSATSEALRLYGGMSPLGVFLLSSSALSTAFCNPILGLGERKLGVKALNKSLCSGGKLFNSFCNACI